MLCILYCTAAMTVYALVHNPAHYAIGLLILRRRKKTPQITRKVVDMRPKYLVTQGTGLDCWQPPPRPQRGKQRHLRRPRRNYKDRELVLTHKSCGDTEVSHREG